MLLHGHEVHDVAEQIIADPGLQRSRVGYRELRAEAESDRRPVATVPLALAYAALIVLEAKPLPAALNCLPNACSAQG